MKKYIIVNNKGNITTVQNPTFENSLPEGWQGDIFVKEVDSSISTQDLLQVRYWDFEEETLKVREAVPGPWYDWDIDHWVFQEERFLSALRAERNEKLRLTDWTQVADSPLALDKRAEFSQYRTALRNITDNLTGSERTLGEAPWPTPPTV